MYRIRFRVWARASWLMFLLAVCTLKISWELHAAKRRRRRSYAGAHAKVKPPKRRDGNGRHRKPEPTPLLRQILVFKDRAVRNVDGPHTGPLKLVA